MSALVERQLTEIWRRALAIEKIEPQDEFFQLGGDSLAAAQIVVDIQKQFGRELPLTAFQESPTIERLAQVIEQPSAASRASCLACLQPNGLRPPFFASMARAEKSFL